MRDVVFKVLENKAVTKDVFLLSIKPKSCFFTGKALTMSDILDKHGIIPGQFIHIKAPNIDCGLRRPFCVYDYDSEKIRLVIAIVGAGTKILSGLKKDSLLVGLLPLGNGYCLEEQHKQIAVLGGGVGVAPLYLLKKHYPNKNFKVYLGFKNKDEAIAASDYKRLYKDLKIVSDDGSIGEKMLVTDAFLEDYSSGNYRPDILLTCGSENMLSAVKKITDKLKIPALFSGEVRMGCGVGACLVCACAIKVDGEVKNLRACKDGPVFDLGALV